MIVVRLARGGAKKHPFYHIVVTDSRRRRDSGYLERLGYFNPFAVKDEIPVLLNRDRFDYWISKGAKSSSRVSSIISKLEKEKFAIKTKAKKTDAGTTKSPKAPTTENELPAETKAISEAKQSSEESKPQAQANLELEDKPESTQEEKQATSPKAQAKSEDVGDALNAETPVETSESSEANKKADQK